MNDDKLNKIIPMLSLLISKKNDGFVYNLNIDLSALDNVSAFISNNEKSKVIYEKKKSDVTTSIGSPLNLSSFSKTFYSFVNYIFFPPSLENMADLNVAAKDVTSVFRKISKIYLKTDYAKDQKLKVNPYLEILLKLFVYSVTLKCFSDESEKDTKTFVCSFFSEQSQLNDIFIKNKNILWEYFEQMKNTPSCMFYQKDSHIKRCKFLRICNLIGEQEDSEVVIDEFSSVTECWFEEIDEGDPVLQTRPKAEQRKKLEQQSKTKKKKYMNFLQLSSNGQRSKVEYCSRFSKGSFFKFEGNEPIFLI